MNRLIQKAVAVGIVLSAGQSVPVSANDNDTADLRRFEYEQIEMGVPFKIAVYGSDPRLANNAAEAAFDRIHELNSVFSDYEASSEVRRLVESASPGHPVPVSPDLFEVLSASVKLSKETGGAFDVTVGHLTKLWRRARRRAAMPDRERLAKALSLTGYRLIRLYPESRRVELLRPGMRIDLGGIAKGYAAEEALQVLAQRGLKRALIDAGGDIVAGAPPPGKEHWRIAVEPLRVEPRENGAQPTEAQPAESSNDRLKDRPLVLRIRNQAVATSGSAYQSVVIDGRHYSHIVNPRTGLGLPRRSSVTVIASSGMLADSLASALSVLEPEAGLAFLNESPYEEAEAWIAVAEGDSRRVRIAKSAGFGMFVAGCSSQTAGQTRAAAAGQACEPEASRLD